MPSILGKIQIVLSPTQGGIPEFNAQWSSVLTFVYLTFVVLPIVLPLLWSRGLCFANLTGRVKDRTFDRYLLIGIVPVLCFVVASALEYKSGIFYWRNFSAIASRDSFYERWSWIYNFLAITRNTVIAIAFASLQDVKWRRGIIATAYIAPLVIQDFFAQIIHLRHEKIDAQLAKFFLPQFASWLEWSSAVVALLTLLTLVEVFRPSLKIAFVFLVITSILNFVVLTPSGWYYLGYLAFSLLFVLTAWQLKALGRPTHSEDLTVNE